MEILNYSLWFTLAFWSLSITLVVLISKEHDGAIAGNDVLFVLFIVIPAIAMLLEYLIVR